MKYTKGPWFVVNNPNDDRATDATFISTHSRGNRKLDLSTEVLGASEWLRVKPADLRLMAMSPIILDTLKVALCALKRLEPESANVFVIEGVITEAEKGTL